MFVVLDLFELLLVTFFVIAFLVQYKSKGKTHKDVDDSAYWFRRYREDINLQWLPVAWQGWLVLTLYCIGIVFLVVLFFPFYNYYSPYIVIPLFLFLALALTLMY